MATKKKPPSKKKPSKKPKKNPPVANAILSWEDDPASLPNVVPIQRPVPNLSNPRLAIKIAGTAPPAQIYAPGTSQFRFWTVAESLRRAADFWATVVPSSLTWEIGTTLPVHLDVGLDLNAFYSRGGGGDQPGLSFFHETVGGVTYFSAESPEVSCHELGHAVLDALRPELWDAALAE